MVGGMWFDDIEEGTKVAWEETSAMAVAVQAVEGRKGISLDDRLNLGAKLLGVGSVSPSIITVASTTMPSAGMITTSTAAYDQRNLQVIASANAGKSRWGRFEVERVAKTTMNGSRTASATAVSFAEPETSVYDRRNANVLSSARAGMSRWGNLEVERIAIMNGNASTASSTNTTSTVVNTSLVDGKIERRVNVGASLLGAALC
jgi:hypothetical protein